MSKTIGDLLHFGQAVALVDLVACCPTHQRDAAWEHRVTSSELVFGDFSPGRYAWITNNLRTFEPFPVTGSQGLFQIWCPTLGMVKAISLWEPWASLMRSGAKTVETRSWYTSYRGPLLICAAKRKDRDTLALLEDPRFIAGLTQEAPR